MGAPFATVSEYLKSLPADRRRIVDAVRKVIKANLPPGYKEGIQYGMVGYFVPHSIYPDGYHCDPKQPLPFASVASQKNHIAIYMMCIYSDEKHASWFTKEWKKTGKRLDMGKSCIRFKRLEDLPLELIGEAVARVPVQDFIEFYERAVKRPGKRPSSQKSATAKKKTSKKSSTKIQPQKKVASKKSVKKKSGKVAAKKPKVAKKVTKKSAPKKIAAKKPSGKKSAARKAAVKNSNATKRKR